MLRRHRHWFIVIMLLLASSVSTRAGVPAAPTAAIIVTSLGDDAADEGACTLREAITAANTNAASGVEPGECAAGSATGSDAISFGSLTGTVQLATALPDITSDLSITGPGATLLTVRRNVATEFRIFFINLNTAVVSISDLTIANGAATGGTGGGIFNQGTLALSRVVLSGNVAQLGGGLFTDTDGEIRVVECTFATNTATNDGGGLNYRGLTTSFITGTTFISNTAQFGGGVIMFEATSGSLTIDNSTFNGNAATGNETGGAIDNSGGTLVLRRSTIANNIGGAGNAGVSSFNFSSPASTTIAGTILADNTPQNVATFGKGTITSAGYNLVTDSSLTPATGDLLNTPANLGPLQNNGGPTLTRAPLVGSAAVDAGDPAILFNAAEFDQRGPGFPRVSGTRIDIGAVERRNPTGETPDDPTPAAANTRVFLPFVRR